MSETRQYELVYIATPDATEQQMAELHAQVEAVVARFGGRLDNTENWGRRKLAYEIGRHKDGVYVLELMTGPGEMMRELDRRLRVNDMVIRHLTVRVDEELRVAERTRSRRKANTARRRIARGLSPEPEPREPAAVPDENRGEEGEAHS
jgi:small subunit ribosomal protein S6